MEGEAWAVMPKRDCKNKSKNKDMYPQYIKWNNRLLSALLLLLLIGLFTGCQPINRTHEKLKAYQQYLSIDYVPKGQYLSRRPPSPPKLVSDNTIISLRLLNNIRHCPVSNEIAQRNSALGIAHGVSTRFIYQNNLIIGLSRCLESQISEDTRLKLKSLIIALTSRHQENWAYFIQHAQEIKQVFSLNKTSLKLSSARDETSRNALSYLLSLQNIPQQTLSSKTIESALFNLSRYKTIGSAWQTQIEFINTLENTQLDLENRLLKQSCDEASKQAHRLFIEQLTPEIQMILQFQESLSLLYRTFTDSSVLSLEFANYIQLHGLQNAHELNGLFKHHTVLWQNIQQQCK